ncbi:hypothetical protein MUU72_17905 [Streptomyces sp. RS10V-4]|uniref:hypothetical protein n=1 Tax=Streptomyces rhizoryzae TaxID=2932493 RepID=UPI0020049025|nr:hypothetical protein [Streptomyces rhizoryzae]MCK7624958.1 hypothetical protein [Streptomyces rhizoryzae]
MGRQPAAFVLLDLDAKPWGARRFLDPRSRAPVLRYRDGRIRVAHTRPRPGGDTSADEERGR